VPIERCGLAMDGWLSYRDLSYVGNDQPVTMCLLHSVMTIDVCRLCLTKAISHLDYMVYSWCKRQKVNNRLTALHCTATLILFRYSDRKRTVTFLYFFRRRISNSWRNCTYK